jgi:SAM-dependent methyltransferase
VIAIPSDPIEQFMLSVENAIVEGAFAKAVLAKPRAGIEVERVTVRPVSVRNEMVLSFVYSYPTKVITKNVSVADVRATMRGLLQASFFRGHLMSSTENVDLSISKKGKAVLHRVKAPRTESKPTPVQPIVSVHDPGSSSLGAGSSSTTRSGSSESEDTEGVLGQHDQGQSEDTTLDVAAARVPLVAPGHDRVKQRFVDVNRQYLVDLGVTLEDGRVVPAMSRKWKQINKFVEILDGALQISALRKLDSVRVVDFGAGKGYLTFALHDHLQNTLRKSTTITGVELRESLVADANAIANRNATSGLQFVCGDIATVATEGSVDVMVALHACDVATDMAIHRGIMAGAAIIVCSPCCHKDVRRQMRSPEVLQPLLQFGVHLGQEADMVTDTIRALLLEANGYDTKVFEFVGLEHSGKNKMILGVARTQPDTARAEQALVSVAALKKFYGISHQRLETLLNGHR